MTVIIKGIKGWWLPTWSHLDLSPGEVGFPAMLALNYQRLPDDIPGICLCLPSSGRQQCNCPVCIRVCCGATLRSSYSHSRHFTDCAIFQPQVLKSFMCGSRLESWLKATPEKIMVKTGNQIDFKFDVIKLLSLNCNKGILVPFCKRETFGPLRCPE